MISFPPSSIPPAFQEKPVKLSCFFAFIRHTKQCVCVFVCFYIQMPFQFITQSLYLYSKVITHDWSESLAIAERKEKFDRISDKNLKLGNNYYTFRQHVIPKPCTKDGKLIVSTETVNLQLFCKIYFFTEKSGW